MTCQIGDKLGDLLTSWTNSSLAHPIIKPVLLFAPDRRFPELTCLVKSVSPPHPSHCVHPIVLAESESGDRLRPGDRRLGVDRDWQVLELALLAAHFPANHRTKEIHQWIRSKCPKTTLCRELIDLRKHTLNRRKEYPCLL